jgi:hypothetical protein
MVSHNTIMYNVIYYYEPSHGGVMVGDKEERGRTMEERNGCTGYGKYYASLHLYCYELASYSTTTTTSVRKCHSLVSRIYLSV